MICNTSFDVMGDVTCDGMGDKRGGNVLRLIWIKIFIVECVTAAMIIRKIAECLCSN